MSDNDVIPVCCAVERCDPLTCFICLQPATHYCDGEEETTSIQRAYYCDKHAAQHHHVCQGMVLPIERAPESGT